MSKVIDSARLTWIDAFMTAAATGSYEEAGKHLRCAPTTVRRKVGALEIWLHRILLTDDVPFELTEDGDDFVPIGLAISKLIVVADLKDSLSKTRVYADGSIAVEGHKITIPAALEIGKLLTASRAFIDPNYVDPPRISGREIDMDLFYASAASAQASSRADQG